MISISVIIKGLDREESILYHDKVVIVSETGSNTLSIEEFVANPDLSSAKSIMFQEKDGFSNTWIDVSSIAMIKLTNVPD